MTAQPASVRLYREHRESARKAADVLRRLNDLFGGTTDWVLTADDLDEIADGYDAARRKLRAEYPTGLHIGPERVA